MSTESQNKADATEDTGVTDVRNVREKIASLYDGDLRKHAAETDRIVAPFIEKLGLKQGAPPPRDNRRPGTE